MFFFRLNKRVEHLVLKPRCMVGKSRLLLVEVIEEMVIAFTVPVETVLTVKCLVATVTVVTVTVKVVIVLKGQVHCLNSGDKHSQINHSLSERPDRIILVEKYLKHLANRCMNNSTNIKKLKKKTIKRKSCSALAHASVPAPASTTVPAPSSLLPASCTCLVRTK